MEITGDNKDEFIWTKDNLICFIKLYESNPCLYVVSSADYKNKDKREAAYKSISTTFNNERMCNVTVAMVKKKTHCIKSQYQKEVNKIKSSKTNGTGTDNIYVPKLWYFPLLQFLCEKSYPVRLSTSTLDVVNHHENSDVESDDVIGTQELEDSLIFNEPEDTSMLTVHDGNTTQQGSKNQTKKRKRQSMNMQLSNEPVEELLLHRYQHYGYDIQMYF